MREFNSALWYSLSLKHYSCLQSRIKTLCNKLQAWKKRELKWNQLAVKQPALSNWIRRSVERRPAIFLPSSLSLIFSLQKKHLLKCSLCLPSKGGCYFGKREWALSQNVLLPGILSWLGCLGALSWVGAMLKLLDVSHAYNTLKIKSIPLICSST